MSTVRDLVRIKPRFFFSEIALSQPSAIKTFDVIFIVGVILFEISLS